MGRLLLFYRLMLRPLVQEPVRMALTILAITLGVAVVLAIDLAGNAATGSFRSSMETLSGDSDLEIIATGGVPDSVVGTGQTLPLIGLDLIATGNFHDSGQFHAVNLVNDVSSPEETLHSFLQPD